MRFPRKFKRALAPLLCVAAGALFGAAQAVSADKDDGLDRILNGHVKAMGDLRAWEQIQSVRQVGRFEDGQKNVRFTEWRRHGDLLRIQWRNLRRENILDVGCNREIAWYANPATGNSNWETIPIAQAKVLRRKAALENPILREARTAFRNWKRLPDAVVNGKDCFVLEWTPKGEPVERFFLDKKTLLLLRREIDGERLKEAEEYDDYRPVAGVLWPYHVVYFENGERVESAVFEEIRANIGVGSFFFRPPQKGESEPVVE